MRNRRTQRTRSWLLPNNVKVRFFLAFSAVHVTTLWRHWVERYLLSLTGSSFYRVARVLAETSNSPWCTVARQDCGRRPIWSGVSCLDVATRKFVSATTRNPKDKACLFPFLWKEEGEGVHVFIYRPASASCLAYPTVCDIGQPKLVAVKLLRGGASVEDKKEFLREAESMINLQHENLCSMLGVAVQQRPWLCVLEYLKYGDLKNVVGSLRFKKITMTTREMCTVAAQIAAGMNFMAGLKLIHM